MASGTVVDLSRWQFAITVGFHMTFPAITVGLSIFLSAVYGAYLRTGKQIYLQIFRFWRGIFGVGFALGVVAGTVITFEFGLDWGPFSHATGPILGPIIAMEVVTAFFVEAGFIGIMLYGDGRVRERTMFISTIIVSIGTLLSTSWILVANSWMQTPDGFKVQDGRFVPTDWRKIIFNPSFLWRFSHMLVAVLISAVLMIAGVAAYYLIKGRALEFARKTFSVSLGILFILLPVQLDLGDHVAGNVVAKYQLSKLEAFEGNWTSTNHGWNVFTVPDQSQGRDRVLVTVPRLGSFLGHDLTGKGVTPGLLLTPKAQRPDMLPGFYGFRIMFWASILMFAAAFMGLVLRIRGRLFTTPWFQKFVLWIMPTGVIAILGGWVTAETGRQPWAVYGQMRTQDAVSNLAPSSLIFSLVAFVTIYSVLLGIWIAYVVRRVRRGPDDNDLPPDDIAEVLPNDDTTSAQPPTPTELPEESAPAPRRAPELVTS